MMIPKALATALRSEGGVFKRIDETRELAELLAQDAPKFLAEHPWVVGWLRSTDRFLNRVATATEPVMQNSYLFAQQNEPTPFPRPYPWKRGEGKET